MREPYEVSSFEELIWRLGSFQDEPNFIFRGHREIDWNLTPKIGRAEFKDVDEMHLFGAWRRRDTGFLNAQAVNLTDWELLGIAQHHGLATRLLDWTYNPLAAAFFAVDGNLGRNAAIFALEIRVKMKPPTNNPWEVSEIIAWEPGTVAARIGRQDAVFTVHATPNQAVEDDDFLANGSLTKIIIKSNGVDDVRRALNFYGVTRANLFPDLDGLSAHMNWVFKNGLGIGIAESYGSPRERPETELSKAP